MPANLNFACLLWEYPKRKFYTEAERKLCKMFCTVGCGGQQTQKRDVVYGRESSSWRKALSWLWKPAAPAVCSRLEEVYVPCKCVRC